MPDKNPSHAKLFNKSGEVIEHVICGIAGIDAPDSIKAVILMTDGAFNSAEFGGQGNSDQQARALCDAMKAQGKILLYTVAFQAPKAGKGILEYCASGAEFAFAPENGEQRSQAYQAIATSISDLRIKF